LEKIAPNCALLVALKNNRDATVPEISLVRSTLPPAPIRAAIHAMFRLGARGASLRDDIHELGKIAAVEGNYPGRHAATELCSGAWSPAPLPSIHPRHHRFDRVTVAERRVKPLEKDRAQHRR
jgi:transposase